MPRGGNGIKSLVPPAPHRLSQLLTSYSPNNIPFIITQPTYTRKMQISTIILTAFVGSGLAVAGAKPEEGLGLEERQTCAIPNVGCYDNNDCCGGLSCDFSQSCCNDAYIDDGFYKRVNCGCCR